MHPVIVHVHGAWLAHEDHRRVHGHALRRLHRANGLGSQRQLSPCHGHLHGLALTGEIFVRAILPVRDVRLHHNNALSVADVLLEIRELHKHCQRQRFQHRVAGLTLHALRVVPIRASRSIALMQEDVHHRPYGVMHEAVLGAELRGQAHTHAFEKRAEAEQLARRVHVHDLQGPPVLRRTQVLARARFYSLRIQQKLLRRARVLRGPILHQPLHGLPGNAHVVPGPGLTLRGLSDSACLRRTALTSISPLLHLVPARCPWLRIEHLPLPKHGPQIPRHGPGSRVPHVLQKPRHVLVLEAVRLPEHDGVRHAPPENPATGIALVVPRWLRVHDQ